MTGGAVGLAEQRLALHGPVVFRVSAAALANIDLLERDGLVERASSLERDFHALGVDFFLFQSLA